jgi:peroxiredoxin
VVSLNVTDPAKLAADAKAPEFTLSSQAGNPVALHDVLATGDVVLVFYRGHW